MADAATKPSEQPGNDTAQASASNGGAKQGKTLTRTDWISFWLCFLVTLGVYTYTLNPTVSLEDSGELAVAADYLGVPHPPGYPIWTLLGWFFQWVFDFVEYNGHPNPAWGVALMSAFFGALACGIIGMLITCSGRHLVNSLKRDRFSMKADGLPLAAGIAGGFILSALTAFVTFPGSSVLLGLVFLLVAVYLLASFVSYYFYESDRLGFLVSRKHLGAAMYGAILGFILFCGAWIGNATAIMVMVCIIVFTIIASIIHYYAEGRTAEIPANVVNMMTLACGVGGGLLFAFSSVMWSQSTIVEVYSLNAFFMAIIALCTYLWTCRPEKVYLLYLTAFLFGLGLTNHQSLAFLMPFLLMAIAYRDKALFTTSLAIIFSGFATLVIFKARQYSIDAAELLEKSPQKIDEIAALKSSVQFFSLCALTAILLPTVYFLTKKQSIHLGTLAGIFIGMLLMGFGLTGGETMSTAMKVILGIFGLIAFLAPCGFLRVDHLKFQPWMRDYLMALCIIGGLAFHGYMALASEQNPPMNWGYPRTPQGFKHALTRGQYEKISLKSNWDQIVAQLELDRQPVPETATPEQAAALETQFKNTKFRFFRQMAAYFYNPRNEYPVDKYSMVNMFTVPLSIIALLPFVFLFRLGDASRTWLVCTTWAMFFLTVMFIIAQYPNLDIQDLFIKRVQYIQAHGVLAIWASYGLLLLMAVLYKFVPVKPLTALASLAVVTIVPGIGLYKEYKDDLHINTVGASGMKDHDFGWQFGYYQLKGANGIILDYLNEKDLHEYRVDDYAINFLTERLSRRLYEGREAEVKSIIDQVTALKSDALIDSKKFKKEALKGIKDKERNYVIQAARLAAYRHKRSQPGYTVSEDEVPDMNYPPPMEQDAVFFGGTDPGRFVPTYMIYSAKVRPDVYLITQNALADGTYMNVMRDLYGDDMWIPSARDSNTAFSRYITKVRSGKIKAGADLNFEDGKVSVQGVGGVMAINAILCQDIHEHNRRTNAFYVEESYPIPWMFDYLTPHGLIMKINAEKTPLTQEMIAKDFEFWNWYSKRLLANPQFQRDVIARKTFSKLRSSLAGMYSAKRMDTQAELAYQQSLELYPLSPEATFKLADFYIKRQRIEDAEQVVNRLIEVDIENDKITQFNKSIAQLKTLNTKRLALESQLTKGGKQDISVAFQLLGVYGSMGMNKQVEDLARSIMANPSTSPFVLYQLGEGMSRLKREALADEIFKGLLTSNPKDYRPLVQLAATSLKAQKNSEALGYLKRAVAIGKDNARKMIGADPRFKHIHNTADYVKLMYPNAVTRPAPGGGKQAIIPGTSARPPAPKRNLLPPGQR